MLIRGKDLTAKQVDQVKAAFVHRNTFGHPYNAFFTQPIESDLSWILNHAFYFVKDGSRLNAKVKHAVPICLVD